MRHLLALALLGCANPEPRDACETPDAGDLEGYCVLGEADGLAAAEAEVDPCFPVSEPEAVAEGPGACAEVSEAVLDAEQAAYEACWAESYEVGLGLRLPTCPG